MILPKKTALEDNKLLVFEKQTFIRLQNLPETKEMYKVNYQIVPITSSSREILNYIPANCRVGVKS